MKYRVGDVVKVKAYSTPEDSRLCVSKNGSKTDNYTLLEVEIIGVCESTKKYLIDLTGYKVVYPTIKEGNFSEIFKTFSLNPKNYHESMIICRVDESGIFSLVEGLKKHT